MQRIHIFLGSLIGAALVGGSLAGPALQDRAEFSTQDVPLSVKVRSVRGISTVPVTLDGTPTLSVSIEGAVPWPPRPENIAVINTAGVTGQIGATLSINIGNPIPVYTVPLGKWLVVTDVKWESICCDTAVFVQDQAGAETVRFHAESFSLTSPVGYPFEPGSTMEIMAVTGNINGVTFDIRGYLVDA